MGRGECESDRSSSVSEDAKLYVSEGRGDSRRSWPLRLLGFAAALALVGSLAVAVRDANLTQGVRWLSAKNEPSIAPTEEASKAVADIIQVLTQGKLAGLGWKWLANITDTFGHRQVGSKVLEDAIDYAQAALKAQGVFDSVHTEPVPNLPNWTRGEEKATLLKPRVVNLALLGVGGTPGTPKEGLTAEAVVVKSFAQLSSLGRSVVEGKVVVFNEPWTDYPGVVAYRYGAIQAAQLGAAALLIRSIASFSVYSPHTGQGSDPPTVAAPIPAACITVEDAEMLWRMQERGAKLQIHLTMTSGMSEKGVTSRNQIFELKGTEKPKEIVLLSGHFDSWDVGTGAMDDGGGVAVMWAALTAIKSLGLRTKRTLRVVLWTAEEQGHLGAAHYHKEHPAKGPDETFYFVSESDGGVFRSRSLNATMQSKVGNATMLASIRGVAEQLTKAGLPISISNSSKFDFGDAEPWAKEGVPGFVYMNQDTYNHYFIFHHTQADRMTVLDPKDIDHTAALYASFAYVIANL